MLRVTTDTIDSHSHCKPSAIEAEQDLLGSLIAGTATPADLPDFSADWFADPVHAAIYRTVGSQIASGSPTDMGSLGSILGPCSETTGGIEPGCVLEEVGGAGYLAGRALGVGGVGAPGCLGVALQVLHRAGLGGGLDPD